MSLVAKAPKGKNNEPKVIPVAYPSSPGQIAADVPVAKPPTPSRRRKSKVAAPAVIPVPQEKVQKEIPAIDVPDDAESVDKLLEEKEYTVVSRLMGRPTEQLPKGTGHLVEVENKNGQKAFVELGDAHIMPVSKADIILQETERKMPIDISEQNGLLSSLGMDIIGIALVCTNGICTLMRTEGPIQQLNYSYDGINDLSDNPSPLSIAYPVIRLADILENPEKVLQQTDRATEQLRKTEFRRQQTQQESIKQSLDQLKENFNRFTQTYDKALQDLKYSIECLKILEEDPEQNQEEIRYNMHNRYRLQDDLISTGQIINNQIAEIQGLSKKLENICKNLNEKFVNVGYLLKI